MPAVDPKFDHKDRFALICPRKKNFTGKLKRGSRPPHVVFNLDIIPVISSKLQAAGYSFKNKRRCPISHLTRVPLI